MSIYYKDEHVALLHGDALSEASKLSDGSVDCIVTSPPYYGLRDYGNEGQYGLEETPADYVETLRALFSELRRVLADDGTLWLNLGDSYASGGAKSYKGHTGKHHSSGAPLSRHPSSLPAKNLLGIPWRVAFALQDDGWILRNSIIWEKPNAMPESVTDRLSGRHENIFMFSKSQRYWFDLDPIRQESEQRRPQPSDKKRPDEAWNSSTGLKPHQGQRTPHINGKNPGDVWSIATKPFPGSHFAVFPPEIPRRAIVAGCKPCGTVLDPFSGSGTTGLVAQENGRKYIGIDISADYLELSLKTRLQTGVLNIGAIA